MFLLKLRKSASLLQEHVEPQSAQKVCRQLSRHKSNSLTWKAEFMYSF